MKKYKYTFPTLALVIMLIGAVLAVLCAGWNIVRFSLFIKENVEITIYNYMSLILAILLSVGYIVVAVLAYFNSYYQVDKTNVILKWGIIKNVIDLNEVKEIKLLVENKKLELVFNDDSYFVIATQEKWFNSFVDDIKNAKPNIVYVQVSEPTK